MDDTLEEEAPKAKAGSGKPPSRNSAAEAPAPKAKARSGSAKRTAAEGEKPARKPAAAKRGEGATIEKPTAARKARSASASAGKRPAEKKPVAKKARAPAKPKQAPPGRVEPKAELPSVPAVSAHAEALLPESQPPAPAALPETRPQSKGPAGDVTIHPVPPHAPRIHPHDDGLEFGLSPVDLAADPSVREEAGLGWFIRILAVTSVLLVLFNSFAIDKWSREQPVTPLNNRVLIAARQLHAEMKSYHLDAPLECMRSVWHGIRDARWPGSEVDRERAVDGNAPAK